MNYLFFYADLLIGAGNYVRLRKRRLAPLAFLAGVADVDLLCYGGTTIQNFTDDTFN